MKELTLSALEKIPANTEINLVLSGGGEKGIAHAVLLEKIEELGLKIKAISASSAGALVGSMYASGRTPQEIVRFFRETPLFQYSWMDLRKPGIFKSNNYAQLVEPYIEKRFSQLQIPLIITTTNLERGETHYHSKGNLIKPLLASCAFPGIFSPIKINGKLHCDGGIMDNFPIKPFLEEETPIVGSYLSLPDNKGEKELNTIIKLTTHATNLKSYSAEKHKFSKTVYTAQFPLGKFNSFNTKEADGIYQTAVDFLKLKINKKDIISKK